jgi:hypothetical protein
VSSQAQTPVGNFSTAAGTTIAKAYGSNVVAGNLLVATVAWNNSSQTCSVAGSLNGALTAIAGSLQTNATLPARAQTFFLVAGSSGAETITATCSGSNTTRELVIYELSGASSTGQPDSSGGGTGNSTNPTGTVTTVAQPGMIVSYALGAVGTVTVGSGYTSSVAQNGDTGEYKTYAATGSTSVPYVDASSGQWVVTAAAFLDAAGGGGGTVVKKLAALGVG